MRAARALVCPTPPYSCSAGHRGVFCVLVAAIADIIDLFGAFGVLTRRAQDFLERASPSTTPKSPRNTVRPRPRPKSLIAGALTTWTAVERRRLGTLLRRTTGKAKGADASCASTCAAAIANGHGGRAAAVDADRVGGRLP